jgi:hypothetical protein
LDAPDRAYMPRPDLHTPGKCAVLGNGFWKRPILSRSQSRNAESVKRERVGTDRMPRCSPHNGGVRAQASTASCDDTAGHLVLNRKISINSRSNRPDHSGKSSRTRTVGY